MHPEFEQPKDCNPNPEPEEWVNLDDIPEFNELPLDDDENPLEELYNRG